MSMSGSMLPPDLRQFAEARANEKATGRPGECPREAALELPPRAPPPAAAGRAAHTEAAPAPEDSRCAGCAAPVESAWTFCAKCGRELAPDRDPVKYLGIKPFTDEDVEEYLFRGYIARDLPLLGKHSLRVRTAQPKDLVAVDAYFVSGAYKDKVLSNELYKQLHGMATVAASLISRDGAPLPEDLAKKMDLLLEQGSAYVDMITFRVALFNRAFTKYLGEQNRLMGS